MHRKLSKSSILLYCGLIIFLLAVHLFHGLRRIADPDEFQMLTNAALQHDGHRLYRDFWDNHGPLATWIWSPAISLWQGGHAITLWLRGLMWLNTVALAAISFSLVKHLFPTRSHAPWLAVLFLLTATSFLSKALEIRGDNPANLLGTLSLAFVVIAMETRKPLPLAMAGLLVGLVTGFTLKVVFLAFTLALLAAIYLWHQRRRPTFPELLIPAVSALLPVAILAAILASLGSLQAFVICYFKANTAREFPGFSSSELTEIVSKSQTWCILGLLILIYTGRLILKRQAHPLQSACFCIVLFYILQFLLFLPTKNLQTLLPGYVPFAIIAGLAGHDLMTWIQKPMRWAPAFALVFAGLLIGLNWYCNLSNKQLPKQVAFADQTLKLTAQEPEIFDPSGIAFLKPKPLPFPIQVSFIRDMHFTDDIDLQIIAALQSQNIRTIVFDKRVAELRHEDMAYIRDNFQPVLSGPNCLLLRLNDSLENLAPLTDTTPQAMEWWLDSGRNRNHQPAFKKAKTAWFEEYIQLVSQP